MQETVIKLSKEQLRIAIENHIEKQNGLHEVFSMVVNGLMYSERSVFLADHKEGTNKGNGYRSVRKAGLTRPLELRIPRDRLGIFEPVIYGLINDQDTHIKELSFSLYGKGLTTRQIGEVMESVYGKHLSKSTISRITTQHYKLMDQWSNAKLTDSYLVVFVDAIFVKVRRGQVGSEAYYTLLGVKKDFTREVLGIFNLPTESAQGWKDILQQLKSRGLKQVGLFVFDNLSGLDQAIASQFPGSLQQKCVLHFQRSLSSKIRVTDRVAFCAQVKEVFNADQQNEDPVKGAEKLRTVLMEWVKHYPLLRKIIEQPDLECYFTYLQFDPKIRRMIYTTNWIERLNKGFRRTLKMRNALPTPKAALMLMSYVAMQFEENCYKYPISNFTFDPKFHDYVNQ